MDLDNKILIFVARIPEETLYFYNYLSALSTVVLLIKPESDKINVEFMNLMCDKGCTVIKLEEDECTNKLSQESIYVIDTLITDYKFKFILTMQKNQDKLNDALFNLVDAVINKTAQHNHYVYDKRNSIEGVPCGRRKKMIETYSSLQSTDKISRADMLTHYIQTASAVNHIKLVQ